LINPAKVMGGDRFCRLYHPVIDYSFTPITILAPKQLLKLTNISTLLRLRQQTAVLAQQVAVRRGSVLVRYI